MKKSGVTLSNAPIATMTPPAEAEEAVDMYFRKMAQVALLTREGEVELARRIEEGERRIIEAIVDSPFAAAELDHVGRLLYKGRLKVRDVVRNVDDEDAFDEATMLKIARLLAAPRHRLDCKASSDFGPLPSDVPSFHRGTRNRAIGRAYRNEHSRSGPQIGCVRRTCLTKCCTRSEP